jgi:hypothetical protein
MRLYSRTDVASVTHGGTRYTPADDGGFDLPPDVTDLLHSSAVGGQKQWETSIERQRRQVAEEMERRKDPATLLAAVEQIMALAEQGAKPQAPVAKAQPPDPDPVKTEPAKAPVKPATK